MSLSMTNSFQLRVEQFLLSLKADSRFTMREAIVSYVFNKDSSRLRSLKKIAELHRCKKSIIDLADSYLKCSYYIIQLQQAIWDKVHLSQDSDGYEVDVGYCLQHVPKEAFFEYKESSKNDDKCKEKPILDIEKIYKYARKKIWKLKFIQQYDPSLDFEDFVQEIVFELVKVYNNKPSAFKNPSYLECAVNNRIRNIISFHTSAKRKRVCSSLDTEYVKRKYLKSKLYKADTVEKINIEAQLEVLNKKITSWPHDYFATTLELKTSDDYDVPVYDNSLECCQLSENSEDATLELKTSEDYDVHPYDTSLTTIEHKIYCQQILDRTKDTTTKEILSILFSHNTNFNKWVSENSFKTNTIKNLKTAAKRYILQKKLITHEKETVYLNVPIEKGFFKCIAF